MMKGCRKWKGWKGKFRKDTHAFSLDGAPFGFGCEGVWVLDHALDV
jgi:hypothetical protein